MTAEHAVVSLRALRAALVMLCLLIVSSRDAASQPDPVDEAYDLDNPVNVDYLQRHLRNGHPRLIMTTETEGHLRERLESDPVVRNMYQALKRNAEDIRAEPLLERDVVGRRLLATSREMLYRMNVLGMVYAIERDPAVLARIDEELLAVIGFEDWNPSHFLDVAEMAMAVAVAVDWVGSDLPPSTVERAKKALIEKGIEPSYDEDGNTGWIYGDNNWNQVCHGGLIAASITVAEEAPELAARTISRALDGLPYAMKEYGPDGVYPEGPTYWGYGTSFSVLTISMLESAFGTDFGLSASPGFMESADFFLLSTAPSGLYFNFADSGDRRSENGNLTLAWFAAKTGNGIYFERDPFLRDPQEMGKLARHAGAGLVWLAQFETQNEDSLPKAWKGEGDNPVAVFRGGDDDPRGYYFGGKGGRGSVNHGNMDAGSFVFELDGVRWSVDPGNQPYHPLEAVGFNLWERCQTCERWTLLTKNNFGHSTLTVNDSLHRVDGFAPLVHFDDGETPEVSFDLSDVFEGQLAGARRTFTKDSERSLLVEDELRLSDATTSVSWQFMTTADVRPAENGAILKQDGQELNLEILSPDDVRISIVSLDPPPMGIDRQIEKLKRVEIRLPAWIFEGPEGEIRVRLSGRTESSPDAESGSSPNAETDSSPNSESDSSPDVESESSPDAEPGSSPDAESGSSPDVETHSSPALGIVRRRFIDDLLEPEIDVDEIEAVLNTVEHDGTWTDIDYEDTSRTGFEHSRHLDNMVALARAYRKEDSAFRGDPGVERAVHAALDFWLDHDFICENWWWNQIGTPERLGNLLLIMDGELTEEQKTGADPIVGRANLDAWGARPGGDLIKIAGIMGKHGLYKRDQEMVNEALKAMAGEIGFAVDRGDPSDRRGLQTDFSFHHRHDRVTSTITYGHGFARYFAEWAEKVHGTEFAFPDEAIELMVDFYLDGICKTMAFGMYPDPGALNRGVTRRAALRPRSPELPEQLLRVSSYRQDELEAIVEVRKGEREPDLTSSRFFWHTEYYSHQRPHYFTSVRMYSSRNHSMEVPYNSEGLKNHHLGDGYNFVSRTGEEYVDIFPVWDWQKIPGTTVVQKPSLPDPEDVQQPGRTAFVGGVTDGVYGAAAFDFESPLDPLSARKSWFFFDDEYVALGAAIRSEADYPVATTLNQSLSSGAVVTGKAGSTSALGSGRHDLDGVAWVHHDRTAYLLPDSTAVRLENGRRRGAWKDINGQTWAMAGGEVRKEVFTLWIDHGIAPQHAEYEYVVVPGMAASEVDRYLDSSPVEIMANTPELQAVAHRGLGLSQLIFYEPGEIDIGSGISVSSEVPGLVMVNASGGRVRAITVSDPARRLDAIRLRITARLEAEQGRWEATWHEEEGYSTVRVDLSEGEFAEQSVSVSVP